MSKVSQMQCKYICLRNRYHYGIKVSNLNKNKVTFQGTIQIGNSL